MARLGLPVALQGLLMCGLRPTARCPWILLRPFLDGLVGTPASGCEQQGGAPWLGAIRDMGWRLVKL